MSRTLRSKPHETRRILYVVPFSDIGGSEQVVLDHIRCLDRSRYEPVLVSLRPGDIVEAAQRMGVKVYALHSHKTRELHRVAQAIVQLSAIMKREKIDLVFANQSSMLLYCGLAAAPLRIPVVWMIYDPLRGTSAFERAFIVAQRRLRPAWVIAISEETLQSYRSAYPKIGNRHSVIAPGTDPDLLQTGADELRGRRTLQIPEGAPVFVTVARLQSSKGHLHLIAAVPRVLERFPDARFVIAGDTQFSIEPEYKERILRAIKDAGLEASMRMTGYISDEQKRDILAASTAIVYPATWEPFGIAIIEGMAVGKPVVAARSTGASRIVDDGKTGYLVPPEDSESLAQAMLKILDDPRLALDMGKAGRQRVLQRFHVRQMVRAAEDVFDRVLAGNPSH